MSNPRATLSAGDLVLSALFAAILILLTPFCFGVNPTTPDFGFCFDLSFLSEIEPVVTQCGVFILLILCCGGTILLNKRFNFKRGTDNSFAAFLGILCATNPLTVNGFSYSLFLLALLLPVLFLLFESYKTSDATQPVFISAALIMGACMVTTSALCFIPILIVGMFLMNIVRPRELVAMIFGFLTPWWILIGFGVLDPFAIKLPMFIPLGMDGAFPPQMTAVLISIVVTFIFSGLLNLENSFSMLSGNIKTRAFNHTITAVGFSALLFMIVDSTHLRDYTALFYFMASLQIGNFFSIHNFSHGRRAEMIILLLYIGFFASLNLLHN